MGADAVSGETSHATTATDPRYSPTVGSTNLIKRFLLLLISLFALPLQSTWAQSISEHEVKAAMVYNFIRFSTLPNTSPESPILLCMLAGHAGADPLLKLDGRSAGANTVKVAIVQDTRDVRRSQCNVAVYPADIPTSEDIDTLSHAGIMTIGEDASFLSRGGIIRFFSTENRIRFEIANDTLKRSGIQISSKVLALAGGPALKDER